MDFEVNDLKHDFFPALLLFPDGGVDVIVNSKKTCSSIAAEKCRLAYDLEGNLLDGGPKPYLSEISGYASLTLPLKLPPKGYFVHLKEPKSITLIHVNYMAGEGTELAKDMPAASAATINLVAHSNANRLYTLCTAFDMVCVLCTYFMKLVYKFR